MVPKQILAEHLLKHFSVRTFVYLKAPVAVDLLSSFSNLPSIPYACNLNIKPSCQIN